MLWQVLYTSLCPVDSLYGKATELPATGDTAVQTTLAEAEGRMGGGSVLEVVGKYLWEN